VDPGPDPERARVELRQDVRQAQEMLNALGYDAGPADGLMGPRTRAAIEAFQTGHHQSTSL
jgi:membrane-bound lytic murein transglycosylase B